MSHQTIECCCFNMLFIVSIELFVQCTSLAFTPGYRASKTSALVRMIVTIVFCTSHILTHPSVLKELNVILNYEYSTS